MLTLEAMNPHIIVIRHSASGSPHYLTTFARSADRQRRRRLPRTPHPGAARRADHPTAARTLRGLNIAIIGDILHSRVARSNIILHQKLGNDIRSDRPALAGAAGIREDGRCRPLRHPPGRAQGQYRHDAARPRGARRPQLLPLHPRIPQPLCHQPRRSSPWPTAGPS